MKVLLTWCFISLFVFELNADFVIDRITAATLQHERDLFVQAWKLGEIELSMKPTEQREIQAHFEPEELNYSLNIGGNYFFYHVKQEADIVGYISFKLEDDQSAMVSQIAILPNFYTADLLKTMIFVIFDYAPTVSTIYVTCQFNPFINAACLSNAVDFGFTKMTLEDSSALTTYELLVHNKCKICEMMGLWDEDEDDANDDLMAQEGDWGSYAAIPEYNNDIVDEEK